MGLEHLRKTYQGTVFRQVLGYRAGIPNIADKNRKTTIQIARCLITRMGFSLCSDPPKGHEARVLFAELTLDYLQKAFQLLQYLCPSKSIFSIRRDAPPFDGYEHLADLPRVLGQHPELHATWGDYLITPDILVGRSPVSKQQINQTSNVLQGNSVTSMPLCVSNLSEPKLILHASISCKWTIRSGKAQNIRTEALNLIRSRKGHIPHVNVVTAEPLPTRLASLALGTGDLDCVYHFALPELEEAVKEIENEDQWDVLQGMVNGRRLRDISDLPFDLAI